MSHDDGSGSSDAYVSGGVVSGGGGGGESSFMAKPPPPFVLKLYHMVNDKTTDKIISWGSTGTSFIVWQPHTFATDVMLNYFKHNNFSSFVTQLSTYLFRKISWDKWEYQNEYFQRGKKHLLENVKRKVYASQDRQQKQKQKQKQKQEARSRDENSSEAGNGKSDEEMKKLRDEHTLLHEEMKTVMKQVEESEKELELMKKESECCRRKQEKIVMFAKQQVLTKEEIGEVMMGKCWSLEGYMDDGVSRCCEGETEMPSIYYMDDLMEGPADWAHYVKELRR